MSQETLNTILAAIAAATGLVTIFLAVRNNRQRRMEREEDRALAEEQLRLARDESLRHPRLRVADVALRDANDIEDVRRTREAPEKWRQAVERAGFDPDNGPPFLPSARAKILGDDYTLKQIEYDGPFPDLVLTFQLLNDGRKEALNVAGELWFERDALEPIPFPKMDGKVFRGKEYAPLPRKEVRLEVGTVPPRPSRDTCVFRIPLLKKRSGRTEAVAIFTTPEGDRLEETLDLHIP